MFLAWVEQGEESGCTGFHGLFLFPRGANGHCMSTIAYPIIWLPTLYSTSFYGGSRAVAGSLASENCESCWSGLWAEMSTWIPTAWRILASVWDKWQLGWSTGWVLHA